MNLPIPIPIPIPMITMTATRAQIITGAMKLDPLPKPPTNLNPRTMSCSFHEAVLSDRIVERYRGLELELSTQPEWEFRLMD
jgi:hypothetical protein